MTHLGKKKCSRTTKSPHDLPGGRLKASPRVPTIQTTECSAKLGGGSKFYLASVASNTEEKITLRTD